MNPHGFNLWDIFGGVCLVFVLACALVLVVGLVERIITRLFSWSGGLLDPRRRKGGS